MKVYCLKWWDLDYDQHIEGYFSTMRKAKSALKSLENNLGSKLTEEEYEIEPIYID